MLNLLFCIYVRCELLVLSGIAHTCDLQRKTVTVARPGVIWRLDMLSLRQEEWYQLYGVIEALIEDQVRQLQAEEAARQMGVFSQPQQPWVLTYQLYQFDDHDKLVHC